MPSSLMSEGSSFLDVGVQSTRMNSGATDPVNPKTLKPYILNP